MSSVLITSTMKSEPATPPMRGKSLGVPVSAAATRMLGGRAEGRRGADEGEPACVAARALSGTVLAVPATATLARNLRRLTPPRASLVAVRRFFMGFLSSSLRGLHGECRRLSTHRFARNLLAKGTPNHIRQLPTRWLVASNKKRRRWRRESKTILS